MNRIDLGVVYEEELMQNKLLLKGRRERERSYDLVGQITIPFTEIVNKRKGGLSARNQELVEYVESEVPINVKLEIPNRQLDLQA